MAEIQQTLPPNVEVRLVRDDSEFIKASLDAIEEHLVLGGILAAIIVLIFLRNFRTTLIAAVAIPTSIIGAFAVIAVLGFTLNQMTMLALTLMVGIVIDDAIVVLENIYRFVEEKGMSPFQAAIEGTREIGLAVMATTLALLAVFIPVGFLGGIVGRFMSSFGLTSAAAIAISLIVSFTLTPMLAARWIKPATGDGHGHDGDAGSDASRRGFYRHIDRVYTALLQWSMAHRWLIVTTSVLVVLSIVPLYRASGVNFTPVEDESRFQISVRLPVGSSIAATQSLVDRIGRDMLQNLPGVLAVQGNAGLTGGGQGSNNSGSIFVRLKPIEERDVSQQELMLAGATAGAAVSKERRHLGAGHRRPDVRRRARRADSIRAGRPGSREARSIHGQGHGGDGQEPAPRRRRSNASSLDSRSCGSTSTAGAPPISACASRTCRRRSMRLIAGQEVTTFNAASDQYEVVLKAQDSFRRTPESIASATVRTASGELVQLRNLVSFNEGSGPAQIDRLNRQRQITISANPAPGISQAEGQAALEAAFASLDMEPGYNLVTSGQSRELGRAAYYFAIAFALSFVFMYMVLAAQFESFIHPITILLTLPLAVPFGLGASLAFGQQLNIYSALGVLLLFGIVKKNAILQIDHTIGLRAQGDARAMRRSSRRIAIACGRS